MRSSVSCVGVETHRLAREQAIDPGAPLLPDAPRLNARGARPDPGAVQHRDRRAALREVERDREADDAGADDHDVRPRAHAPELRLVEMFDYAERQRRLAERMEAEDVDVLFLAPSADLEYLTGVERQIPNFGEASYANGWVAGAFFSPGRTRSSCFPRMFVAFDLQEEPDGRARRRQRDGRRLCDVRASRARPRLDTALSQSATASGPRRS